MCVCMLLMLKCCFTSTETVGVLGTGAQDGHLDFHTALELCVHAINRRSFITSGMGGVPVKQKQKTQTKTRKRKSGLCDVGTISSSPNT